MGARATRMLLEFVEEPARPHERVDLATSLVIRETCRSPAR